MLCRLDNLRKGTACATIQRMDWDYVGNEWAVKMLKQQAAQDSTRHAYILAGPQGIGKRTLALRFIQALNCPKAEGNGEPCLECRSCRQIEAMQYSDMQVVEMLEDKSAIIIDQIRQVQQFLSLTAYESKAKTALLVNFQNANTQAQNALLKTLEEVSRELQVDHHHRCARESAAHHRLPLRGIESRTHLRQGSIHCAGQTVGGGRLTWRNCWGTSPAAGMDTPDSWRKNRKCWNNGPHGWMSGLNFRE